MTHITDTPPLNLLIADDHPAIREMHEYMMTSWGHHADIVSNGLEAVEHARTGGTTFA